ncbi:MAG: ABC transporter transmembrane domain-containing protein, partial [Gemmatimonadota bacterium]
MRRLLAYLRPYWLQVAAAIGMLILASGLELVGPWLTKLAIDQAFPQADYSFLSLLGLLFLGSLALSSALVYAQTILTTWIGQRVMIDLRDSVFGHLQRLELKFFDRNPVGRLMTRVTSDIEVLNEMFTSGVVTIFGDVFTIGAIVTAMLLLDWRLALVTFAAPARSGDTGGRCVPILRTSPRPARNRSGITHARRASWRTTATCVCR